MPSIVLDARHVCLDIKVDGWISPCRAGHMLIGSMFGSAFQGNALIDKAISANSPYYGEADAWQSVQANIDAIDPNYS